MTISEQYEKGVFVINYLEKLGVHPIVIAEAVSDDYYKQSYELIKNNPTITKEEFLAKMGIEDLQNLKNLHTV